MIVAGLHPLRDRLKRANGHKFTFDWANCPECHALRNTVLLAASDPRPPDFCNVCIYTCEHVVQREKRKCRDCGHVWVRMESYP